MKGVGELLFGGRESSGGRGVGEWGERLRRRR